MKEIFSFRTRPVATKYFDATTVRIEFALEGGGSFQIDLPRDRGLEVLRRLGVWFTATLAVPDKEQD